MVWQSSSAHTSSPDGNGSPSGGGGGSGGVPINGSGSGSQTAGAEYTLQGVMRFLQTEWHRHERDRNNWEIERAEMKSRIAKLEGENHAEKRLHQVYLARIKILERALKKERADRLLSEGKAEDSALKADEVAKEKVEKSVNEKLSSQTKHFDDSRSLYRAESARNQNRANLEKCLQEITYLLTPPNHPAPQQQQQQQQQQGINDSMLQQQQHAMEQALYQQQNVTHSQMSQPSPSPNHQPPPPPSQHNADNMNLLHRNQSQSHAQNLRGPQQSSFQVESRLQPAQPQIAVPSMSAEQNAEKVPQPLNAYSSARGGKKDTNPFSQDAGRNSPPVSGDVGDAWDFEEKTGGSDTDSISSSEHAIDDLNSEYGSLNHSGRPNSIVRRKLSLSKRRSGSRDYSAQSAGTRQEGGNFKVKYALRGHLDVVRAVVFTGGGTASEPEICTTGDDGVLKRWYIPGNYSLSMGGDVDVSSHFTHRGHAGIVTSLAACPPPGSSNSSGRGTADVGSGSGWIFSGGQDATVKVWEAGRVESKATLVGHTDTVWAVCILPSSSAVLSTSETNCERILLASGSSDGTVKIWSVTPPPVQNSRPSSAASSGSFRLGSSYTSGGITFNYSLIATITRPSASPQPSPTCITPMSLTGETFIVAYTDASVIIYDTASGEEVVSMMSQETYDGTSATGVTSVVSTTMSLESGGEAGREEEMLAAGATGLKGGVGGVVISGHEDQYVRIYDANSGQCTYTMLAHPAAIASLALSPDGRELVSAGHDASLRFWSMEKRACYQEITSHRLMRGEGVCTVVWSSDGRWVVSGGGDGVVKVYAR